MHTHKMPGAPFGGKFVSMKSPLKPINLPVKCEMSHWFRVSEEITEDVYVNASTSKKSKV